MTDNTKRSWQLQAFTAHGPNVNCLALGQKSGRVLVTGGVDKKVNLWAIGKENCIMSLGGHLTPVKCVKFTYSEDMVCTGSQAGALKQWDLEAAKLFRTLTGHKNSIKCIDFHPYGDLLASGSLDTFIKLWDCRKKASIFTYKGHDETVNSLKFSPDGQWIASGGNEGCIKLWDLRAGRLLKELHKHSGPVANVEFHPQEFLLVTSSADRSVSFWDLENFHLVSESEKETASIRCLIFSSDGICLLCGCTEQLKAYGWEPARIFDTVTTGWGEVQDMAIARDQLIGASFNLTRVAVYVVDVNKVCQTAPLGVKTSQSRETQFFRSSSVRKSFNKQKPKSSKSVLEVKAIDEECDTDDDPSNFIITNVNDYETVFKPNRSLNRNPRQECKTQSKRNSPLQPPSEPTSKDDVSLSATPVNEPELEPSHIPVPVKLQVCRMLSPLMPKQSHTASVKSPPVQPRLMTNGSFPSKVISSEPLKKISSKTEASTQSDIPTVSEKRAESSLPDVISRHREAKSDSSHTTIHSLIPNSDSEEMIPPIKSAPVDIHLEEFLPTSYRGAVGKLQQLQSNLSESEIVSWLTRNHEIVLTILKVRQKNLEIIYSSWHNQDLKYALESALSMDDQAVLIDVMTAINKRPSLWNLDVCVVLLPAISNLVQSKYEMYMTVCCQSLHLILKNFSSVIKTNIQWSSPTIGVDISKEERYNKCIKCYEHLISIRTFLLKKQTMQGKLGQSFRELHSLLYAIEK